MKQKLLLMLKTLFASKGFSQKALEGLADILAPNLTDESTTEELTAAIEGLKPMTDIMQSEINRQVNDAKKPKVDPKPANDPPTEGPKPDNPAPASTDPVVLELLNQVKTLAQGLKDIQVEKVGNTRREQFIASMKGTSKEYQERELKRFDRMKFETDDDFNAFLEDTKDDHADAIQEETNNGLGGDRPAGGTGGASSGTKKEATEAEVDAAFKDLKI